MGGAKLNDTNIGNEVNSQNFGTGDSSNEDQGSVIDSSTMKDIDLIPKTLGNMCFYYLFHLFKWFFFFWVISGVVIANLFDLFFSSYILLWIILFLECYAIQHFALSDLFKKECLYCNEFNHFLIFLFIVYPILFLIFVFLTINVFNLLDIFFYSIFGVISVFLNRKMIKTF